VTNTTGETIDVEGVCSPILFSITPTPVTALELLRNTLKLEADDKSQATAGITYTLEASLQNFTFVVAAQQFTVEVIDLC